MVASDSAGVQIVEVGLIDDREAFRLAESPEYVVGWEQNDYPFYHISGGKLLSDGRAALTDAGNLQIVILSRSGAVETVLGAPGEGPGEFVRLMGMGLLEGDTIVAEGSIQGLSGRRFSLFHGEELVRVLSVPDFPGGVTRRTIGIDPQGRLALHPSTAPAHTSATDSWFKAPLLRVDLATGRVDTVFTFDFVASASSGRGEIFRSGSASMTRSGYLVGRNDRPLIEFRDFDGRLIRVLRWKEEPSVADDMFWSEYRAALIDSEPNHTRVEELIERLRRSGSSLPYFRTSRGFPVFLSDDLDNIWLPVFSPFSNSSDFDARYRVFSPQNEWLGWVEMPERSRVLDVRDGRALLLRFDQYRTRAVAVYRLEEVQ